MRYENWDVLLFPGGDHVPLKEFKTECHVVPDDEDLPLGCYGVPVLNTFVPSLHYNNPFSISILSWGKPPVSQATKSYSNHPELVLFEFHVYIDGRLVSTAILNQDVKGPSIIQHSFVLTKNGELDSLRFPVFHKEVLQQQFWNAGDNLGRIKITMTESFPRDSPNMPFERVKNVVTFSFQHAPLEILESSAIAWPNPTMWYSALLSNDTLPEVDLPGNKSNPQRHVSFPRPNTAEEKVSSHAVLTALASLQSATKAEDKSQRPVNCPVVASNASDPDVANVFLDIIARERTSCPEILDTASNAMYELPPPKNVSRVCSDMAVAKHASSYLGGQCREPSYTLYTPSDLSDPSQSPAGEQQGNEGRPRVSSNTPMFALNGCNHPTMCVCHAQPPHGFPYPGSNLSNLAAISQHPNASSTRMNKSPFAAAEVASRKESQVQKPTGETTQFLNNLGLSAAKPDAKQKKLEPAFTLSGNANTINRASSLKAQSQKQLDVLGNARRSGSFATQITDKQRQDTGLTGKRGRDEYNFNSRPTQAILSGTDHHLSSPLI